MKKYSEKVRILSDQQQKVEERRKSKVDQMITELEKLSLEVQEMEVGKETEGNEQESEDLCIMGLNNVC